MKIKVIASNPAEGQDHINHLIGKEFEIVPFNQFDKEDREEMKSLGHVAIRENDNIKLQYILNKGEYEIITTL